jgi:CshA-type fibril repeat protein
VGIKPNRLVRGVLASSIGLSAVTLTSFGVVPSAYATPPVACAGFVPAIANGGFESPTVPSNYQMVGSNNSAAPAAGIAWDTTDPTKVVEIWHTGFNGVPADTGTQFAELNANNVGTLSENLATTPGFILLWSLAHRGRQGSDTMTVSIGPPGGPLVVQTPSGAVGPDITDGTSAWGHYNGAYTIPAGQTTTRFAFNSVSAAGGNQSIGNFLDSVVFTVGGTACDDSLTAITGVTSPLDVLANDKGNGLSITGVTTPAHGTASIVSGKVAYTPTPGFVGNDTFDYTIVDSFGVTDTGTVTVTVPAALTTVPLTSSGVGTATQTATATIPTSGSVTLLSAANLPVTSRTVAGQGTYTVDTATGLITFAPMLGYSGTSSVPYQVSDVYGQKAQSTYQPTVTPPAPPAPGAKTSGGVGTALQSATLTIPASGSVTLLDGSGNPTTTRTIAGKGTYALDTATGILTFAPVLGYAGTATPTTYRVTDAYGQTGQSTYTPTVTTPATPAAPALTSSGVGTAVQSTTLAIPVGGSVTLLIGGSPVSSITVAGQGAYHLDAATGALTFTPVLGFSGTATPADYQVTDAYGQSAASTSTPTVTMPAGPTATPKTSSGVGTAQQSTTVPIPTGGTVTLRGGGSPVTSIAVSGTGSYVLDTTTGVVTFTPVLGFAGTAPAADYQVTDAYGQNAASTYTPSVTTPAGPSAPARTSSGVGTAQQSVTLAVPVGGSVTLLDGGGSPVSARSIAGQGSLTLTGGVVTFDPELGFTGMATPVAYQVTDAYGQSAASTYTATVTAPAGPGAPAKTSTGAGTTQQSVSLALPTGGSVTLLGSGGGPVTSRTFVGEGTYTLDATSGALTFDPVLGFAGTATPIQYEVTDAYGQTAQAPYTPTVTNPAGPTAPARTSTGVGTAEQTTTLAIPASGSVTLLDAGSSPTSVVVVAGGAYSLDVGTGDVTFDPTLGFSGTAPAAHYRVSDAYGQTATSTYTPSVTLPAPPAADPRTSTGVGTTPQSATLPIPAGGSVSLLDHNGAPVTTRTIDGQGSYALDTTTGLVTFTPLLGYMGTASPLPYQLTNAYGQTASSTYTPTVTAPVAPGPVPVTSSGVGITPQSAALPVPGNSTVRLLDSSGNRVDTLVVTGQGTFVLDPATSAITFTPVLGFRGNPSPVEYQVTDAYGQVGQSTYSPSVVPPSAPTPAALTSSAPAVTTQKVKVTAPASGTATLIGAAGTPVSAVTIAGEGTYTFDPQTGTITFLPVFGFAGVARPVSYRVTDAYGQKSEATYTPAVTAPHRPTPPAKFSNGVGMNRQTAVLAIPAGGRVRLVDGTGQSVTRLTVASQGNYALDTTTGVVTFAPAAGLIGAATPVRYRATDAYGQNGASTYTPLVRAVTGTPTVASLPSQLPFTGGHQHALLEIAGGLLVGGGTLLGLAAWLRGRELRRLRA